MIRKHLAAIARIAIPAMAILAAVASQPALAQISEQEVVKGKVKLNPAQGYLFLRSPGRFAGTFMRVPDEAELEKYRADRAAELQRLQAAYPAQLARWERNDERNRRDRITSPPRPIEPTDANMVFDSLHSTLDRQFGPLFAYAKNDDSGEFSYFVMMQPGRYIWYGPTILDLNQGYIGSCFCMGSVQFDVAAGQVTDLGNFLSAAPRNQDQPTVDMSGVVGLGTDFQGESAEVSYGLPASLAAWPARTAEFHASGKMGNFNGVMISRLAPIPGVLGYRRDVVIDERTGAELP